MNEQMFLSIVNGENAEVLKENANMNSDTPSGLIYKLASEVSKEFTDKCLLDTRSHNRC